MIPVELLGGAGSTRSRAQPVRSHLRVMGSERLERLATRLVDCFEERKRLDASRRSDGPSLRRLHPG
jgi:hypothetical protein